MQTVNLNLPKESYSDSTQSALTQSEKEEAAV